MAESSKFWQDISNTDTSLSNYLSVVFQNDAARAFVLPGYGSDLKVHANSPAALNVLVETGAVLFHGRVYENTTQQTLTLDTADAANPRLDRIVLRITFASQTIRVAVLSGTAAATPSLPSLTQDATTYEISLGYVWVAAATVTIDETEVHDERLFAANFESLLTSLGIQTRLRNTEFLATITARTYPPASWSLVVSPSAIATATRPSQMGRGNAIQITADASNEGIQQSFACDASAVYTIKTLVNVTAGDVGSVVATDNGASPATITRNIRRTGAWIEETIYYTTPADATTITVQLLANSATDVIKFGQTLAVKGYIAGPFREEEPTSAMVLLDEIELSASAATVSFNIPSGFKHIQIVMSGRADNAVTNSITALRLNGDSGSNYDYGYVFYDGSSWTDAEAFATTFIGIGSVPGSTAPANAQGDIIVEIPDYLETTLLHQILTKWQQLTGTAAPNMMTGRGSGRYRTAGAITALTLVSGGNFVSGTRISIYGYN